MKDAVIAELFSKAAGRCSICKTGLFIENVKIGEMAHIIAKRQFGPRGNLAFDGDLNSYENLILLCPNHHSIVDGNPIAYPVEALRLIKANHESWVNLCLQDHSKRHQDIAGLQALMRFLPFTQIRSLVEFLPDAFYPEIVYTASAIETFPIDNPQCRPFDDPELELRYSAFVDQFSKLYNVTQGSPFGNEIYVWTNHTDTVMRLNRDLPYQEKASVRKSISEAVIEFIPVYHYFLEYLQSNYREVDICAYRPA